MRRTTFIIIGITLFGLLLRLFILSQRGSLWFDEAFSVHFAAMNLGEIWNFLKFENNPPLYFYILHFWMQLFGNSELAVRTLSMIFGIASIPMVYVLGVRLHSRAAGLFASFLTAISTFQAFYSTETRMYSMYLFFTLVAVLIYLALEQRRQDSRPTVTLRVLFFLVLSVLIWTHITAWWFVLVFAIYILWKEKFSLKQFFSNHYKFLILVGFLVLQFLPWAANFIRLKIAAPLSQGYFFYLPPDRNYFLDIVETFLVFGEDSAFVITILSAVVTLLLWHTFKVRLNAVKLLTVWLITPLLVGFAFSNAVPRYFIAVAPALYLLMGIGFAQLSSNQLIIKSANHRVIWAVPLLLFALVLPDYPRLAKVAHHEWDKLGQWIGQQENIKCQISNGKCLVIVNPHSEILPFGRYYKGALPTVGFYPREDEDRRDLRIVKTNWVSINTKENVRKLADVTVGYNRVFLITGEIDQTIGRNLVPIWFWENGWQRASSQEFGRIGVMELVRLP